MYNPQRTERDIHDEWDALTEQVKAEDPECKWPEFRAKELWRKQEEKAERWSEWQKRVWFPRMKALADAKPNTALTKEEWVYLADFLNGANHPLAMSIQVKAAVESQP